MGRSLSVMRLFLALGFAAMESVWALHLDGFGISPSTIGFATSSLVIISLITALFLPRLLSAHKLKTVFITSLVLAIVGYVAISMTDSFWAFIGIAAVTTISRVLRLNSGNIIFRDSVPDKELNRSEGFLDRKSVV